MNHKQCYGRMLPTMNAPPTDRPIRGKAFEIELQRAGGMAIVTRLTAVDMNQWDDCLACDEFSHSYKLCLAKLALETGAMQN